MATPHIYLASSSPRRRELLAQIGLRFEILLQSIPEKQQEAESPRAFAERLAREKAWAGWSQLGSQQRPVLGADTIVVVDDEVLGKPRNKSNGLAMLSKLSGRSHRVLSAVAMVGRDNLGQDREQVVCSESEVWFRPLTVNECEAYWDSGEPVDKAGAYAIQGLAALFIERLEGSYSGVMGLPLFETGELLRSFGIELLTKQSN